jgi:hypothetical protein
MTLIVDRDSLCAQPEPTEADRLQQLIAQDEEYLAKGSDRARRERLKVNKERLAAVQEQVELDRAEIEAKVKDADARQRELNAQVQKAMASFCEALDAALVGYRNYKNLHVRGRNTPGADLPPWLPGSSILGSVRYLNRLIDEYAGI